MTKVSGVIGRLNITGSITTLVVLGTIVESGYNGSTQYVYYTDGYYVWRKGVRDGYIVWDKSITGTWLNENTDWFNVKSSTYVVPVGTAPVFVSAVVENATPTKVTLTYDQTLDMGSVPATTDFTLDGKTISLVEVSGATVTLTVSVTYDWGDVIAVSYTKGSNPIQGSVGGVDADNLVSQSVTNNITYPVALDDANHWWYDATDLATITKDGSNLVSVWAAKGGAKTGKDLLQATETKQPLWVAPGTIRFDGVDNFLKSAAFTWNQPEFIYILFKQITWANTDRIFDGNYNNGGSFYQSVSSPNLRFYAGGAALPAEGEPNLALNTWGIARVLFNGADSKFIIDNNTPVTGNPGTNKMGGFTLGKIGASENYYGNIEVKDIVCVDIDDAANETEIYNWLVTRKP